MLECVYGSVLLEPSVALDFDLSTCEMGVSGVLCVKERGYSTAQCEFQEHTHAAMFCTDMINIWYGFEVDAYKIASS